MCDCLFQLKKCFKIYHFCYYQAMNAIFPSHFFLFLALIIPNTMCNMVRGFTTLGLFSPPRVCYWDACRVMQSLASLSLSIGSTDGRTPPPSPSIRNRLERDLIVNSSVQYDKQMSRNGKWAGLELAICLMIQIQQNYEVTTMNP